MRNVVIHHDSGIVFELMSKCRHELARLQALHLSKGMHAHYSALDCFDGDAGTPEIPGSIIEKDCKVQLTS